MTRKFQYGRAAEKAPYHYTMCGLDDVYLVSGYELVDTDEGQGLVIHDMDGLHRTIGLHLVCDKKALNPKEVRFLRKQLDWTQAQLSAVLSVTDQTVARWEKGEVPITGPAELLLRVLFLNHLSEERVDVLKLAEKLHAIDAPAKEEQVFAKPANGDWEPFALAA